MERRRTTAKNIVILLCFLLLAAIMLLLPRLAGSVQAEEYSASILTARAEERSLVHRLYGGGVLSGGEETEIRIPEGVAVTELYIGNGDFVHTGDKIAEVDRVSVLGVVAKLQSSMDILKRQMSALGVSADEITAEEDETFYVGGKKADTDDLSEQAEYRILARQHREYEELAAKLVKIYDTGYILAEADGLVHGVDKAMLAELAKSSAAVTEVTAGALYSTETHLVCAIVPQEMMSFTVRIDERDIAGIFPGMPAEVTLDALPGQLFSGTVKEIGALGSGGDGSSKFDVTVELPCTGDMLPNMSAAAVFTLEAHENVLSLPVAALIDRGGRTLVYTGYDAELDMLVNPVEVVTGFSDGEYAEILSGIQSGDAVWYAYYDKLPITDKPQE